MVNEFSSFAIFPSANPSPNNLNDVAREVMVLFQAAHRDVSFTFEQEKRLPLVQFDRDQIKRVLINLLDNAIAALGENKGERRNKSILIRSHYNEKLKIAVLDVQDNGSGISPIVQQRLFEPYFSTKKDGTGLGLSIVKRIISDHSGFIRVQSKLGEGTKFTIELPINLLENTMTDSRSYGENNSSS